MPFPNNYFLAIFCFFGNQIYTQFCVKRNKILIIFRQLFSDLSKNFKFSTNFLKIFCQIRKNFKIFAYLFNFLQKNSQKCYVTRREGPKIFQKFHSCSKCQLETELLAGRFVWFIVRNVRVDSASILQTAIQITTYKQLLRFVWFEPWTSLKKWFVWF